MEDMTTLTIPIPGDVDYEDVVTIARGFMAAGWTCQDPDCWGTPQDTDSGNWEFSVWQ